MKKTPFVLIAFFLPVLLSGETIPYGIPYKPRPTGPITPGLAMNQDGQGAATPNLTGEGTEATVETDASAETLDEENQVPVVPTPTITEAYSRSDFDGVVIAADKNWYLEEADSLGRPTTGTLWKDGTIVKVTSWLYYGDSQRVEKKIETASDQSTETGYDKSGNVVLVSVTSSKGDIISRLVNTWNEKGLLSLSIYSKDKTVTRTEYEYDRTDGKDVIKVKKLFKNDELVSRCDYSVEDSWVETVFNKGKAILAVDYVKGERKGKHDEEKF
jgi:hypothetical protein